MKFHNAIGIDVSKGTFDAHDYLSQAKCEFANNLTGFNQLIRWAKKLNGQDLNEVIICFEHTGLYSLPVAVFLTERQIMFCMVPGLEIKRSLGITRGKSDIIAAGVIAEYAYLRREKIKLYQLPSKAILKLKGLLSFRERMVKQRAGYKAAMREMKAFMKIVDNPMLFRAQGQMISQLDQQIKRMQKEIQRVISENDQLKTIFNLVSSVRGVGLILGASLLVYTNCFTAFETWRKFACYSGIAPFPNQSGISWKGKRKVHYLANKKLKTLLSNAAASSIQFNPEMRLYYQRRLAEGKSKMSTLNIIRNKIVARAFAVVKRGTPYVDTLKFAA